MVETIYSNGAYRLANPNDDTLIMSINGKFLKKYYLWSLEYYISDQESTIHDHVNIKPLAIKTDFSYYFFYKKFLSSSGINFISSPPGIPVDIQLLWYRMLTSKRK